MKLNDPLQINEIDFRVQSISEKGWTTILAYKDARADMKRLDDVYGPGRWQRKHEIIGNNLYCNVGVWDSDLEQWIWVQDVGTESNTEKEKGQASDSFKRACFNLGIGRELYDYPRIFIQLKQNEFTSQTRGNKTVGVATWDLRLKQWSWYSEFVDGSISFLAAIDDKGTERFKWGYKKGTAAKIDDGPIKAAKQEFTSYMVGYMQCVTKNMKSIDGFKECFSLNQLSGAAECWYEIEEEDQIAIYSLAPSKGGILTTEERAIMKSNEWRESRGLDNE